MLTEIAVVRGLQLSTTSKVQLFGDQEFGEACNAEQRATFRHGGDESEWRTSGRAAAVEAKQKEECDQIPAFFDSHQDRIVIRQSAFDGEGRARQLEVLAHELEHAVQAHALPPPPSDLSTDATRALQALREGDATVTAGAFLLSLSGRTLRSAIPNLLKQIADQEPQSLHSDRFLSYSLGSRFVLELYQRGGFLAVNDAFARPPASTAEILHVDRYLATHSLPPNIESRLPLPAPFETFASESRGEYRVRDILAYCVPPDVAMAVASEWEADDYTASKVLPPSRHMFRWITDWRSEDAARRFADVVSGNPCLLRGGMSVANQGRVVVLVGGLDGVASQKYANEVLADVLSLP